MSKKVKKFFQGILSGLMSASYKQIGAWILVVGGIAWNSWTGYWNSVRLDKNENPGKELFNNIVIMDKIYPQITEILKECETDGIFIGFFAVSEGVGKFLGLQGKWDIISGLTAEEQYKVRNPQLIQDPICRNIATTLKVASEYLSFDNTKYTNNIYLQNFTPDSSSCKIDKDLQAIMTNTFNQAQVLQLKDVNTLFVQCLMANLNLPHFNNQLEALYFYPIKIRGFDYSFLTLSFTKKINGRCFSQDLTKQKKLFQDTAKIYQELVY